MFKYPVQYQGLPTLDDVFADLRRVGIAFTDYHEIRQLPLKTYERAVDILLRWFPHLLYDDDRKVAVYLMSRPCSLSEEVIALLLAEMEQLVDVSEFGYRWNVAQALHNLATRATIPGPLSDLAFDIRLGRDRIILIHSFGRARHHDILDLLARLTDEDDPHIVIAAAHVLGRVRDPRTISLLKSLVSHVSKEVRQEATKALRRAAKRSSGETALAPINRSDDLDSLPLPLETGAGYPFEMTS